MSHTTYRLGRGEPRWVREQRTVDIPGCTQRRCVSWRDDLENQRRSDRVLSA